jgi:phage terminase large subunit
VANLQIAEPLQPILNPKRYKVLYGGRGGGKSWTVAGVLLLQGLGKPLRILCAREFQNSIKDSVHQLLSDLIAQHDLRAYTVTQNEIRAPNGTLFIFEGLRHNVTKIKSYEGIDICWVEEAQNVSKTSWDTLIPTIRKDNSEIWITFNPQLEDDETYQRFIVRPPKESVVIKVNYTENPFFSPVLKQEMEECRLRDPVAFKTIWEGECATALQGAIYENEMREANEQGRILTLPYDPRYPVATFWDIGWADHTSIWYVQQVMGKFHVIDFYENRYEKAGHYCKVLHEKPYRYDRIYLPHDAEHQHVEADRTMREIVATSFPSTDVRVLDNFAGAINVGIQAVRNVFPLCYFDKEKCADGLRALRYYHYKVDPDTGRFSKNPDHDFNADAADSFRYCAMAMEEPMIQRKKILMHPLPSLRHDGYAA